MFVIAPILTSTLLEAFRSRLAWVALAALAVALALAAFLQSVALVDHAAVQASVVSALLRAVAVFLAACFVVTSMLREATDKVLEILLARPIPRFAYLAGKLAGFCGFCLALAVSLSLPLLLFAPAAGVAAWALSLFLELLIVACVGAFCAITMSQTVSALAATAGFYVLSRTIETMRVMASSSAAAGDWSDTVLQWAIEVIAALLPSLERMTLSGWLLQEPPGVQELGLLTVQAAIYVALIVSASLFDLYRKNI